MVSAMATLESHEAAGRRAPAAGRRRLRLVALTGIAAATLMVITLALTCARTPDLSDPMALLGTIRIAQENYRAETLEYVNASSSPTSWYPSEPQGTARNFENASHRDAKAWKNLKVVADGETAFGFVTLAGNAGSSPPPSPLSTPLSWPRPSDEPWFVAYASGRVDGKRFLLVTSSFNGEIHVERVIE